MVVTPRPDSKRSELFTFLILAFVLIPALSIAVVVSYGFAVWMYQIIAGPPGM